MHNTIHSGIRPFKCPRCEKTFRQKKHMKTHENTHTGNKPFACLKCGMTFTQSSNRNTHAKRHMDLKLPCNQCDVIFKSSKGLNGHIERIHEKKIFPCIQCQLSFTCKAYFNVYAKQHSQQETM